MFTRHVRRVKQKYECDAVKKVITALCGGDLPEYCQKHKLRYFDKGKVSKVQKSVDSCVLKVAIEQLRRNRAEMRKFY